MEYAIFALVLLVVLITHEAGHALAMRAYGVQVQEFGLGIPFWKLPSWRVPIKNGKFFLAVHPLLLGGYVKRGDADEKKFLSLELIKRMDVKFAGVFANFLTGGLLFFILALAQRELLKAGAAALTLVLLLKLRTKLAFFAPAIGLVLSLSFTALAFVGTLPWLQSLASINMQSQFFVLSTAIGIFNLIPIPPFDGGAAMLEILYEQPEGSRQARACTLCAAVWAISIPCTVFLFTGFPFQYLMFLIK